MGYWVIKSFCKEGLINNFKNVLGWLIKEGNILYINDIGSYFVDDGFSNVDNFKMFFGNELYCLGIVSGNGSVVGNGGNKKFFFCLFKYF